MKKKSHIFHAVDAEKMRRSFMPYLVVFARLRAIYNVNFEVAGVG